VDYLTLQYQLKSYLALNETRGIQPVNCLGMEMKGWQLFHMLIAAMKVTGCPVFWVRIKPNSIQYMKQPQNFLAKVLSLCVYQSTMI